MVILADVFAVPFRDIADAVGLSEAACRQLASRARRRVRAQGPTPYRRPDDKSARIVGELLAATTNGEVDEVARLLGDRAVLVSDGGAERRAARGPVRVPARLARSLVNLASASPMPVSSRWPSTASWAWWRQWQASGSWPWPCTSSTAGSAPST
ncbi:MAG: hypothetical protein M3P85_01575 [Actinomycetota bacterium]|nr:hypothetical protein [Actinomycetota bacterium]